MKHIILFALMINSFNLFSQDTLKIYSKINESIELTAPQKYYTYYSWNLPNNNIINNKTIDVSFQNVGEYLIECIASDNCVSTNKSQFYKIVIQNVNSVLNPIEQIVLFPNPVNNIGPKLFITSTLNNINCTITITNTIGTVLNEYNETLNLGTNFLDYTNDFSNNYSGIYYLTVSALPFRKSYKIIKE